MVTKKVRVDEDVRDVLAGMAWEQDGTLGRIERQLYRDLYVRTNKALEVLGGKWNRSRKGHVFDHDPRQFVEGLAENGELDVQVFDAFYTPFAVIDQMMGLAELRPHTLSVLEPNAGDGRIADAVMKRGPQHCIYVCEINPQARKVLAGKGYLYPEEPVNSLLNGCDFMEYEPGCKFDRVIMNPPFSKKQWIAHIERAWNFLRDDDLGVLVSVIPYGGIQDDCNTYQRNLDWIAEKFDGWLDGKTWGMEALPHDTFKEAGTGIRTAILVVYRMAEKKEPVVELPTALPLRRDWQDEEGWNEDGDCVWCGEAGRCTCHHPKKGATGGIIQAKLF